MLLLPCCWWRDYPTCTCAACMQFAEPRCASALTRAVSARRFVCRSSGHRRRAHGGRCALRHAHRVPRQSARDPHHVLRSRGNGTLDAVHCGCRYLEERRSRETPRSTSPRARPSAHASPAGALLRVPQAVPTTNPAACHAIEAGSSPSTRAQFPPRFRSLCLCLAIGDRLGLPSSRRTATVGPTGYFEAMNAGGKQYPLLGALGLGRAGVCGSEGGGGRGLLRASWRGLGKRGKRNWGEGGHRRRVWRRWRGWGHWAGHVRRAMACDGYSLRDGPPQDSPSLGPALRQGREVWASQQQAGHADVAGSAGSLTPRKSDWRRQDSGNPGAWALGNHGAAEGVPSAPLDSVLSSSSSHESMPLLGASQSAFQSAYQGSHRAAASSRVFRR